MQCTSSPPAHQPPPPSVHPSNSPHSLAPLTDAPCGCGAQLAVSGKPSGSGAREGYILGWTCIVVSIAVTALYLPETARVMRGWGWGGGWGWSARVMALAAGSVCITFLENNIIVVRAGIETGEKVKTLFTHPANSGTLSYAVAVCTLERSHGPSNGSSYCISHGLSTDTILVSIGYRRAAPCSVEAN